jgi:hypothetical protein
MADPDLCGFRVICMFRGPDDKATEDELTDADDLE